jgi:hypothetical protein
MTSEEVIEAGRLIADMRNVLTVLTGTTDADTTQFVSALRIIHLGKNRRAARISANTLTLPIFCTYSKCPPFPSKPSRAIGEGDHVATPSRNSSDSGWSPNGLR